MPRHGIYGSAHLKFVGKIRTFNSAADYPHLRIMLPKSITKLYYSIGEVASMVGVETHVLRYWEAEFDELRPRKNRVGRRIYTAEDIAVIESIMHLLRVEKYTVEGARRVLRREDKPRLRPDEKRLALLRLRGFLENIADQLQ